MTAKLLIADDEPPMRRLLQQSLEDLEDEGVEIFMAQDGSTALEIIKSEKPGLILLDVMMPELNGFEVCKIVKQELKMEGVTVILLTAKGQEADRQQGQEVGADQYITKPFDPDELLSRAAQILDIELTVF